MKASGSGRIKGVLVAAVVVLAGCAAAPYRLAPGTTAEEVRTRLGEPRESWKEANGGTTWVYPTGPAGYYTYMVRLDPSGRVSAVDQVLDDRTFARIELYKTTEDDVRHLIGPPWRTDHFPRQNQTVWDYYVRDDWSYQYPVHFYVTFNDQGVVTQTMKLREFFGGDLGMR